MDNRYELYNGILTILMPKELDHHSASDLKTETDMLISMYHVRNLVFDFKETEFMDSSGIGVMIGRCKNMNYGGGSVMAKNLSDRVKKIFMVSGLNKIIKVE